MSASDLREDRPGQSGERGQRSWLFTTILFLNITFLCLAFCAYGLFGSIDSAIRFVAGWGLFVDHASVSFGTAEPNQRRTVSFLLRNRGTAPIRVLGCRTSCTCVVPDQIPFSIAPGKTSQFRVSIIHMPGKSGRIHLPVNLYTDSPNQRELALSIEGRVEKQDEAQKNLAKNPSSRD